MRDPNMAPDLLKFSTSKDIAKIVDQKRMALKKASQKSMRVVLPADLLRIAH